MATDAGTVSFDEASPDHRLGGPQAGDAGHGPGSRVLTASGADARRRRIAALARRQAAGCGQLGSRLYDGLLRHVAEDVEHDGPAWRVLEVFADWPADSAFHLRLLGALHRLALRGDAPELAALYAAEADADTVWPVVRELLDSRGSEIRALALANGVQTNEVGRCAALAPAILWLSGGMPVRLLEIGASAGLNLRWDAYRYEDLWGDPASPVRLLDRYHGRRPPFEPAAVDIVERRGCDPAPLDPTSDAGRLAVTSFVWPDQRERLDLLRGAFEIAGRVPATVDAEPAKSWLERHLRAPARDCLTVVFHSIVWQYIERSEHAAIRATIAAAGARADAAAPLAWLRMEPEDEAASVRATVWPGERSVLLARAGFHGRPVSWEAA